MFVKTILATLAASAVGASAREWTYPEDYSHCAYDPETAEPFKLIDSKTYLPMMKNEKGCGVDYELGEEYWYKTVHPEGAPKGVYDLVYENNGKMWYLAMHEDGSLAWAEKSSYGPYYVAEQDAKYMTTVFTVECSGRITAHYEDKWLALDFTEDNTAYYTMEEAYKEADGDEKAEVYRRQAPRSKGKAPALKRARATRTPIVLTKEDIEALALADAAIVPRLFDTDRCPNGQSAVTKDPAVFTTPNGCGTQGSDIDVPDFGFEQCCNGHDLCFDNCSRGFDNCNNDFVGCMVSRCDADFGNDFLKRSACKFGAGVFGTAVKVAGFNAFHAATEVHCDCA